MPNILSKWVRNKLTSEGSSNAPLLPVLSSQRPHVLTPTPSQEHLVANTTSGSPTTTISFFQRFPFEVRRKILIEAFGGQTVHMDLSCADVLLFRPEENKHEKNATDCSHAKITSRPTQQNLRFSRSKPKRWQWWSSVCHRSPRQLMGTKYGTMPYDDQCAQGSSKFCDSWDGDMPTKCFIGAMGWLLSSRQAYAEGIDVLYSTNTIHMTSDIMILHLPQLILPQRLATIKSIEIQWYFHLYVAPYNPGYSEFDKMLKTLSSAFPHLQKLYLSLQEAQRPKAYPSGWTPIIADADLITPIAGIVRDLPHLQDCDIAVSLKHYNVWRLHFSESYPELGWRVDGDEERLWRELPRSKFGDERHVIHLPGYWIGIGRRDDVLANVVSVFI